MRHRSIALILLLAIVTTPLAGAGAPSQDVDEYQVKAALLYNFARFVEWPAEAFSAADSPLRICALGTRQFGTYLDSLAHKVVQGRRVEVVEPGDSRALTQTCHVLFVGRSVDDVGEIVSSHAGSPILTVTEFEQGGGRRGIINLVKEFSGSNGDSAERFRIVFEIDVAAARVAGLQLGSRLLELALVRGNTR